MRPHLLLLSLLIATAAGCSSERGSSSNSEGQAGDDSTQVALQTFEGVGVVRSILPNKKYLTIAHEDIPGFMSAMEMPFALKDTSLATGVAPGDSVRFVVEVEGPYIRVARIEASR